MGATAKQAAFARAIVSGLNPSEAYKAAGYSTAKMKPASVAVEAQKVLKNPNVSLMVRDGLNSAATAAVWSRVEAVKRLEAVNWKCLEEIKESDNVSKAALDGFMSSMSALNGLTNVREEVVRDEQARYGYMTNGELWEDPTAEFVPPLLPSSDIRGDADA